MNDLISRQAAIDAIFSEPLYKSGMQKRNADAVVPAIYEKIKSLPSSQPYTEEEIQKMQDLVEAAIGFKRLFDAFVQAGFTEDQTINILTSMAANQGDQS